MTFQYDPSLGPCTYPGRINTAPACTTSLKLVLVKASNLPLLPLPSPLRKTLVDKFFNIRTCIVLGCQYDGLRSRSSSFFSIAYWENVGLFVSIACPRSRKKGVRSCQTSVPNIFSLSLTISQHFLLSCPRSPSIFFPLPSDTFQYS